MISHIIDLHGCNVEEATAKVINALFAFDIDKFSYSLNIICGRGEGVVKMIVLNILDDEKRDYKLINNGTEIVIFKNENNDFSVDEF